MQILWLLITSTTKKSEAIQRNKEDQVTILPIIIRACDYSGLNLNDFKATPLPADKRAIRSWDNRDAAWLDVINGITDAIEQLRGLSADGITLNIAGRSLYGEDKNEAIKAYEKLFSDNNINIAEGGLVIFPEMKLEDAKSPEITTKCWSILKLLVTSTTKLVLTLSRDFLLSFWEIRAACYHT